MQGAGGAEDIGRWACPGLCLEWKRRKPRREPMVRLDLKVGREERARIRGKCTLPPLRTEKANVKGWQERRFITVNSGAP